MPRRIVLISDLQQGSRLEALGDFEWPADVELEVKTVADDSSNAGLQRLADPVEARRRRPTASRGSGSSTTPSLAPRAVHSSQWTDADRDRASATRSTSTSRRARAGSCASPGPRARRPPGRIVLKGDADGVRQHALRRRRAQEEATVLFVGDDRPDDPDGLLYYLMRVFVDTPRRTVKVVARPPAAPVGDRPGPPDARWSSSPARPGPRTSAASARTPRRAGPSSTSRPRPGAGETLGALAGCAGPSPIEEAPSVRDALLGEIAFDHPLFAPLRRTAVQRLHQDPLLEASPARRGHRPADSGGGSADRNRIGGRSRLLQIDGSDRRQEPPPTDRPDSVRPRPVRERRPRRRREGDRQGQHRRHGQRLEPGRQPARAVVEVRPADDGPARPARPAAVRRRGAHGRRPDRPGWPARRGEGPDRPQALGRHGHDGAGRHGVRRRPTSRGSTRSTPPTARGRSP